MNIHKNARLTFARRLEMVQDVLAHKLTHAATAAKHDISAVQIMEATNYYNVLWGDDYPHLEGTYGHTQATLKGLFQGVSPAIRNRVLRGTFAELFPSRAQMPEHLLTAGGY